MKKNPLASYDYDKAFPVVPMDYNPEIDRQEVEQFGFIDVAAAFESGVIPGITPVDDESFNGVSTPSCLMTRPADIFEARRQVEYVRGLLADASSDQKKQEVEKAAARQVDGVEPTPSS